ncbi:MAG: PEP-utilizing enzyme [Actinomycetota bacterium]|nr:PEP-utilizing enzyme [Actinomycetota bacterium]
MEEKWFTDYPPSERYPHYTRANAGEVLPTPASPFGQTYGWDNAIGHGFQEASIVMGAYEADDYRDGKPEMVTFFGGFLYINMSCVRMQAVRNPAITVDQLDLAFFGDRPDTPPYEPHPLDAKPHLQAKIDEHMQFVLTTAEWPELDEEKKQAEGIRKGRPALEQLSDSEIVDRLRDLHPTIREFTTNQMVTATSSGIPPGMLAAVAEAIDDPTMPMRVLAGLGDVDSAAPSFALWELSRLVRDNEDLTEAFNEGIDGLLQRIGALTSSARAQFIENFNDFVFNYGSRGPNEWELSAQTWETDQTIPLKTIDQVRKQSDDKNPALGAQKSSQDREELVASVRSQLAEIGDEELSGIFEGALVGGNQMVFRERAKTSLVRVLHESRMAIRELGRRHVDNGNIGDLEHIFMLLDEELEAFIADPASFTMTLEERYEGWTSLWDLTPPFFLRDGIIPPLSEWVEAGTGETATAQEGETLPGTAGSPGVIQGTARIVTDPTNPPDLLAGDIMVAPLTDPAWTPLFLTVDGVVVNVGGQVSHAVIVSRELGIPCVVSVEDATERIEDGTVIEVNGTKGEVTIIRNP